MNKKIMAAISMILVFSFLFAFTGCSPETEEETTTTITAKTPLPTDITTSFDEENSEVITDTTYSPEMLEANTDKIFNYFNTQLNLLKSGVEAKVEMSQSKGINKSYKYVELTKEEIIDLVKTVLDEETPADFNGDLKTLSAEQYEDVKNYGVSEGRIFNEGETVTVTRKEDVPMSENDYINAAINTLDSYMLHEDGYKIDEYVDVAEYLPVAGADYVSALTREDVKSATCVDQDGQRVITLTLKGHEFPDEIEKEIIAKAYNVETVKSAKIVELEGKIGEANGRIEAADKIIAEADKAIAKAEKKNDAEAKKAAEADKAAAVADKTAAEADKAALEKEKRTALTNKTIDQNVDEIMKEFESANSYLTATKPTLTYKDCQIIITANLETDDVHTIEYKKSVDVKTDVTGTGSLKDIGTVPVAFNYSSTVKYTIERPAPETTAAAE